MPSVLDPLLRIRIHLEASSSYHGQIFLWQKTDLGALKESEEALILILAITVPELTKTLIFLLHRHSMADSHQI